MALETLHEALRITTLCMAPFTPFITERVWQDLFRPTVADAAASVHLAAWPAVDASIIDNTLADDMALVRRIVELGRAARATSGVRTRQPLGRALVSASGWATLPQTFRDEVCEELNVTTIETLADDTAGFVDTTVKANFRALGQRFGKQTPLVAAAIGVADPVEVLLAIRTQGMALLTVDGIGEVSIAEADVVITETPREGWAVASDAGESLALDLTITEELRRSGMAREIVRAVQEARKQAGFEVSDRINVVWSSADATVVTTILEHSSLIADEVLATGFDQSADQHTPGLIAVTVPEVEIQMGIARI